VSLFLPGKWGKPFLSKRMFALCNAVLWYYY
jgi:hypothetical protein